MTVCIAAIADTGFILGASDRMLTSGDVEFEPHSGGNARNQKILPITSAIVAMAAGDMGLQSEIFYNHVLPAVNAKVTAEPTNWLSVSSIVDLYINGYNIIRRNRAEVQILAPLGLTYKSFSDQSKFSQSFLENITKKLLEFSLYESVETIIVGVEPGSLPNTTFSRLFVLKDNIPTCCDSIRFAAIGIGARHAESHFMQVGHGFSSQIPETLISTYVAKKRAEIAPGVGKETSMFLIGGIGAYSPLDPLMMPALEKIFKEMDKRQRASISKAVTASEKALADFVKSKTPSAQAPPPSAIEDGKTNKDEK